MKIKFVVLLLVTILIYVSILDAQDKNSDEKLLILSSNPSGAVIQMKGEYLIRGITPLKIPYDLEGIYKIKAERFGYEKWNTVHDFTGLNNTAFTFSLTPKSRFKAFVRSFVFPGWGQFYSDRKLQATLIAGIQLTSTLFLIKEENNYQNTLNNYESLFEKYYNQNISYLKRENLKTRLIEQEGRVEDAYDQRQMWMFISATIWTYNILDALFFFHYDNINSINEIFPYYSATEGQFGVGFNMNF